MSDDGFTVLELLVSIAIIGILSTVILSTLNNAKDKAYYSRALSEYRSISTALELYSEDHYGQYPADVNRDLPSGIEIYLNGQGEGDWPDAPWPNSVYDWDNWEDPDYHTQRIIQISIRFCPAGGPLSACHFPKADWAEGFGINSALYYCIQGNCRSHINESIDYPGYCVNCGNNN